MPRLERILLLSVSVGAGHTRAAEALCAEARANFPGVEAKHVDVMTLVPASFRRLYADSYLKIVEHHPSVWAYLYHASDKMPRDALFAKLRRAVERLNTRQLRETICEFSPDHVICTHFLPAELLAHEIRRKRIGVPIWVQVTDFDLHRLWVQPGMRGYSAASEEIAFRMAARGKYFRHRDSDHAGVFAAARPRVARHDRRRRPDRRRGDDRAPDGAAGRFSFL